MKIVAMLALLVFCQPGPAQTKPDNQIAPNARIYEPKNISQGRAKQVAKFVASVVNGVSIAWDDVPHAIVIRGQTPADIDAAEVLLKRFDVPEPKEPERRTLAAIDCTVYLIRASSSSAQQAPPTTPIPPELQPALDEMKHSFGYDRYAMWDSLTIQQGGGGGGEMQGILPVEPSPNPSPYVYSLSYKGTYVSDDKSMTLHNLEFSVKMPSYLSKEGIESHIKTEVTIHEGQKLVLGKIRLLPGENADLFLVLATKVH